MSSGEDFNMLENSAMTSAGRGKFSTDFKAPSKENLAAKHSLKRGFSLSRADQGEKVIASEISGALKVTEEPQAQILKPDLEIPHQAKFTSIPLSFFPSKLQQLLLAAERKVSEAREAIETQSVIYIWPVIKMQESSRSFWHNFSKSLMPSGPDLTRHCSSPDVIEDEKSSQITSVKKLAQEEPDGKTARFYPLIVKSSNSSVSEILKSLTNIKNKDYKNMLTLSSISPIGEQQEIPLFKGNALMIYNGQVYLLYVMRHEDLAAEMKISAQHMFMKTIVWLITCRSVRKLTFQVSHPLLLREDAVKQNIKCLTTCATPTLLKKTSNETCFSSHMMTTTSQPENYSPLAGKRQQVINHFDQFLCQTAFPSKEDLQERHDEEALRDKDKEIRKKFGLVKGVRVVLNRLSASELRKWTAKPSARKKKCNH
ncbi:PREDICTED: ligand-dependent nuclear receptor-interacting factor 1-like [Ficedula albicollis]|uniref:ligand-dependent nuclear receptor-interacting factor 1-like n=1 Tax=Ficedula albicollis TaxID=59894 RepID=UPI00035A17F2|nr:PREDICTED: ligand-dependent nuclear receptor-interacting factor 1-like [Ficedula albicollis]XP_005043846.1 PREDICTED: ligand-dependent nuclear receptor-interacting factor 1-like [Ficedula albicollis]XP_005043847.1 PREDICTED: ligand-dependent nuclear receptor-interacting factor 1-like [Ficedula albicollis]